jgi:uncharacterized protein YtpQ (UPF0354 family)
LRARGSAQEHLFDDLNEELVIVYAEDDPSRMRYLIKGEDIGVARDELRTRATANLTRLLPKIEMRVIGDVMIISAGGDYEPSLLLIDDIWSGGQIKVKGDIVVAVPARDALLVTGSRSPAGLKALRASAAEIVAKGPYALVDTLFVYRGGRFTRLGRNWLRIRHCSEDGSTSEDATGVYRGNRACHRSSVAFGDHHHHG